MIKKLRKIFFTLLLIVVVAMPFVGLAQATESGECAIATERTIRCIILDITDLIRGPIVALLWAALTAAFLYGLVTYMYRGGDEKKRKEGIQFMVWSVVAFFVMISIWGLVNLLGATFNLSNIAPEPPTFPEF